MRHVLFPTTCNELFQMLSDVPESRIMAGGTDLLVSQRTANQEYCPLIVMERMEELSVISKQPDGGVSIGACVTFSRIMTHSLLVDRYSILTQAASCVGGPAIRNMATIGGNIATASPAGDSLPPLYLLAAVLEISAANGSRMLPIDQFICSPRKTVLQPGEIISRIILPPAEEWDFQRFEKVGKRKSLAIAVASLAAMIRRQGERVVGARLAWGSVGPTVFRCPTAEQSLLGRPLSEESLSLAAGFVRKTVQPIDDLRASAAYRRTVAGNLLLRLSD